MLIYGSRITFLLAVLIGGVLAAPSEMYSSSLSKNHGSRSNEVRDSPLERVQVKQESGFDGRVRSIRFSLEPELDVRRNEGNKQRFIYPNNLNFRPIRAAYNQNLGLPMTRMFQIEATSPELPLTESIPPTAAKQSRSKRETDSHLNNNLVDDLETAEGKVFRPLFVYRQQVSRRLKKQNERYSNNNLRRIRSQSRPHFGYYYYPYQFYHPYEFYP